MDVVLDERAGSRIRVEPVNKAGDGTRTDVQKRQRSNRCLEVGREAGRVVIHLGLDPAQRVAWGLCLEDPNGLPVDEEQVVGEAALVELELSNRDSSIGTEVDLLTVLDGPASLAELSVDLDSGDLLRPDSATRTHGPISYLRGDLTTTSR